MKTTFSPGDIVWINTKCQAITEPLYLGHPPIGTCISETVDRVCVIVSPTQSVNLEKAIKRIVIEERIKEADRWLAIMEEL